MLLKQGRELHRPLGAHLLQAQHRARRHVLGQTCADPAQPCSSVEVRGGTAREAIGLGELW